MGIGSPPDEEPRGWVKRLGMYLRIFGPPASGTLGYRTSGTYGPPDGHETYLDQLVRKAQEREAEFGRIPTVLRVLTEREGADETSALGLPIRKASDDHASRSVSARRIPSGDGGIQ